MGSFYVTLSVQGTDQNTVIDHLAGVNDKILVGPDRNGWVGLASEGLDQQNIETIDLYGVALSQGGRVVFAVLNHDDAILEVSRYYDGTLSSHYNSCPGYFSETPAPGDLQPSMTGKNAFFGSLSNEETAVRLKSRLLEANDNYVVPFEIHTAVVHAFGLPDYTLGMGFNYVQRGESKVEWASTGAG